MATLLNIKMVVFFSQFVLILTMTGCESDTAGINKKTSGSASQQDTQLSIEGKNNWDRSDSVLIQGKVFVGESEPIITQSFSGQLDLGGTGQPFCKYALQSGSYFNWYPKSFVKWSETESVKGTGNVTVQVDHVGAFQEFSLIDDFSWTLASKMTCKSSIIEILNPPPGYYDYYSHSTSIPFERDGLILQSLSLYRLSSVNIEIQPKLCNQLCENNGRNISMMYFVKNDKRSAEKFKYLDQESCENTCLSWKRLRGSSISYGKEKKDTGLAYPVIEFEVYLDEIVE